MKILLIEDSYFWQKTIQNCLQEANLPNAHLVSSVQDAIDYLNHTTPDLIIADIIVKKSVVFDVFNATNIISIPTIFITSSENEMLYENKPSLEKSIYMIKPIHPISLKSAIEHLTKSNQSSLVETGRFINVKSRYNEKIPLLISDVICVKAERNYCIIKTLKVHFLLRVSLLKMKEKLGNDFVQIHRAYLVNKNKITEINLGKHSLTTALGELPIGPNYKDILMPLLKTKYELH